MSSTPRKVTTLFYAFHGDAVAMIRRAREPNLGLWSPPGGRIELDETPLANATRELREETGLEADDVRLRAVVTELDPVRGDAWLMFVFVGRALADGPLRSGPEGDAEWVPATRLATLPAPPADRHILEAILSGNSGVAFLDVRFRDARLTGVRTRWA